MALADKTCKPCEGGTQPMAAEEIQAHLGQLNNTGTTPAWEVSPDNRRLSKRIKLKNFVQAVDLVNRIKDVAEAEKHHPDLEVGYGKVVIHLSTHAIGGLSENDFILAAKIDALL